MQKLVACVSEPSSDLKIPFHVSCKFVFLCLVKASCNQTEKNVAFVFWAGLEPQGGENAQTKRPRQKEQKRSRKEAFVKKNVKQLCERVRHSDVFTSKKSKIEISTCYISACFALLAGSSAVAFLHCVAFLSCTLACAKLCESVHRYRMPFFVRGQTCNKKISSCQIRCRLCFSCFSVCVVVRLAGGSRGKPCQTGARCNNPTL